MVYAKIVGVGSYLPKKKLPYDELMERWDVRISREFLEDLLPVTDRRESEENEACSDMIVKAAENVLKNARDNGHNVYAKDLTSIIVSANPPDYHAPATAKKVHNALGAGNWCRAYDLNDSCVGWIQSTEIAAAQFNYNPDAKYALVMAAAKLGKGQGRRSEHRAMFGDGAGGFLLGRTDKPKINKFKFFVSSEHYDKIILAHDLTVGKKSGFYMKGIKELEEVLKKDVEEINIFLREYEKDIKHVFVHRTAKEGIYKIVIDKLPFPKDMIYDSFTKYGNTVSADLPIELAEQVEKGNIKKGDLLFFLSYGSGVSMGGAILEY